MTNSESSRETLAQAAARIVMELGLKTCPGHAPDYDPDGMCWCADGCEPNDDAVALILAALQQAQAPAPAEEQRLHCNSYSPPWFRGAWRDWHRGHGCYLDDGKPRSPAGRAEIEGYTAPADPGASAPPEESGR